MPSTRAHASRRLFSAARRKDQTARHFDKISPRHFMCPTGFLNVYSQSPFGETIQLHPPRSMLVGHGGKHGYSHTRRHERDQQDEQYPDNDAHLVFDLRRSLDDGVVLGGEYEFALCRQQ